MSSPMRDVVSSTDAATWHDASMRDAFLGTLDYEVDVLSMLSAYREMILYQGQWHDTLSPASYDKWSAARDEFMALGAAHTEKYDGNVDYPAYNLTAANSACSAPTAISRWRGSRGCCCCSRSRGS